MKIEFLGFGSAFNPAFKNTNAYFEISNNLYFIDFGESAFETVKSKINLENYNNITVIITHLHGDHVGSLPTFISYVYYILGIKINLIHPNNTIVKLLDLMGIKKECYCFYKDIPQDLKKDLNLIAIKVDHVDNMESYAYIVEAQNQRIYFSGDAANVPNRILRDLEANKLDRIYQDTSSENPDKPTHCPFKTLKKIIKKEFRHKVFCVHLDKDFRDEIQKEGFSCIS